MAALRSQRKRLRIPGSMRCPMTSRSAADTTQFTVRARGDRVSQAIATVSAAPIPQLKISISETCLRARWREAEKSLVELKAWRNGVTATMAISGASCGW